MVIFKLIFYLVFSFNFSNISIEVQGTAFIEENISNARMEAKKDAFNNAIKITILNLSKNPSIVKSNEYKLKYKIYQNSSNYVDSYKFVSEEKTQDILKLKMLVVINTDKLKKDLIKNGISLERKTVPKVLSFISEKSDSSEYNSSYIEKNAFTDVEENLSKHLSEQSFALINPYDNEIVNFPSSSTFLYLKKSELIDISKNYDADLILLGYIDTSCSFSKFSNQYKCSSLISLQVISCDLGRIIVAKKIIDEKTGEDKSKLYTQTRENVVKSISDYLVFQLTKHWKQARYKTYLLKIKNLNSYESYSKIKSALNDTKITNIATIIDKYQSKDSLVLGVDISLDNYSRSKRLILNRLNDNLKFKKLESNNEDIIIELVL